MRPVAGERPRIRLLTREDCPLCDEAEAVLRDLRREVAFTLDLVDVDGDADLRRAYGDRVPVATCDGEELFDLRAGVQEMREAARQVAAGSP